MPYQGLGKQVRMQRLLKELTQEQLAEKAGISVAFVGHIERGTRKASLETVVRLANALEVTTDVLLQDSLDKKLLESDYKQIAASIASEVAEQTIQIVSERMKN